MKTITLWQPWASLIACGAKRIETRSWPTSHRGPLAIHAAKCTPAEVWTIIDEDPALRDLMTKHFRHHDVNRLATTLAGGKGEDDLNVCGACYNRIIQRGGKRQKTSSLPNAERADA